MGTESRPFLPLSTKTTFRILYTRRNNLPDVMFAAWTKRTMNTRSSEWFYSDFVIDGTLNPPDLQPRSFGGLNRNLTEQKLDLLQFASGSVAMDIVGGPP